MIYATRVKQPILTRPIDKIRFFKNRSSSHRVGLQDMLFQTITGETITYQVVLWQNTRRFVKVQRKHSNCLFRVEYGVFPSNRHRRSCRSLRTDLQTGSCWKGSSTLIQRMQPSDTFDLQLAKTRMYLFNHNCMLSSKR